MKTTLRTLLFSLLALSTVVLFQNCGVATPAEDGSGNFKVLEESASAVRSQINATIGLACATDAECASVASGEKICGGPERYEIYSTTDTDTATLRTLVDRYTALQRARNTTPGLIGDCMFVTQPEVGCVSNSCSEI